MITLIAILIIGYIFWGLHYNPVHDDKFTKHTIIRVKLMQEDLKHHRVIGNYYNLQ